MASTGARFLWVDGHHDIRDVDEAADQITVAGTDGRSHVLGRSGRVDAEGLPVWIEESREWERFHRNGRRAVVCQHADVHPGRYSAGAPLRGDPTAFQPNIGSLEEAQRIADTATGCRQPCDCPPWSG
jgi:hypothetical protein